MRGEKGIRGKGDERIVSNNLGGAHGLLADVEDAFAFI